MDREAHQRKCGQVNDKKKFGLKSENNSKKRRIFAGSGKVNIWPIFYSGYQKKNIAMYRILKEKIVILGLYVYLSHHFCEEN